MILKLRNQPNAPKWEKEEREKKDQLIINGIIWKNRNVLAGWVLCSPTIDTCRRRAQRMLFLCPGLP
jgi:hypothetical protein